jgi:A/G-specific adenine glycosylase
MSAPKISTQKTDFCASLLAWFQPELRQMPWRETSDPYQIWISEIMLQQTQVQTVKPYFKKFVERFPTVQALAESALEPVLKHWEGLGYYSRARNLHKGAQVVVSDFAGQLPQNRAEILKIPGIGPYTAGAVLSIAFQLPEPAIDGNVLRVFSRLYALAEPIDKKPAQIQIEAWVRALIDPKRPGDFNQALMELGATVCSPSKPKCGECPLRVYCQAAQAGNPEAYPRKAGKTQVKTLNLQVALLAWQGHYLLKQEKESGIFRDLWVLPWSADGLEALEAQILTETGLKTELGDSLGQVEHTLTHRQMKMALHPGGEYQQAQAPALPSGWAWYQPGKDAPLAVPVAHQKIFKFLDAHPILRLIHF